MSRERSARGPKVVEQPEVQESVETKDNVVELTQQQGVPALSETDRMALELAKSNMKLSQLQAEKALAQNETSQLAFKYVVLQLYMKYGLSPADALNEDGTIIKNGALNSNGS